MPSEVPSEVPSDGRGYREEPCPGHLCVHVSDDAAVRTLQRFARGCIARKQCQARRREQQHQQLTTQARRMQDWLDVRPRLFLCEFARYIEMQKRCNTTVILHLAMLCRLAALIGALVACMHCYGLHDIAHHAQVSRAERQDMERMDADDFAVHVAKRDAASRTIARYFRSLQERLTSGQEQVNRAQVRAYLERC